MQAAARHGRHAIGLRIYLIQPGSRNMNGINGTDRNLAAREEGQPLPVDVAQHVIEWLDSLSKG
jgi:hypothetical protein